MLPAAVYLWIYFGVGGAVDDFMNFDMQFTPVVIQTYRFTGGNLSNCVLSLLCLAAFEFDEAEALLAEAETYIVKAHNAQTEVIQSQVSGEDMEYSLLFIHSQDTEMTITTELRMAQKMLPIFKALKETGKQ